MDCGNMKNAYKIHLWPYREADTTLDFFGGEVQTVLETFEGILGALVVQYNGLQKAQFIWTSMAFGTILQLNLN